MSERIRKPERPRSRPERGEASNPVIFISPVDRELKDILQAEADGMGVSLTRYILGILIASTSQRRIDLFVVSRRRSAIHAANEVMKAAATKPKKIYRR